MTASSDFSQDLEMEGSSCHSDQDQEEDGGLTQMSSLCPLWDNMLPLDAAMLKSKQVRARSQTADVSSSHSFEGLVGPIVDLISIA